MQKIFLFFIYLLPLFSAPIDKAFFEGENVLHYYDQVEQEINSTITKKLKPSKTITLERSTLKKLRELYKLKGEIPPVKTVTLPSGKIPEHTYMQALYRLADLHSEIERLQNKKEDFQKKLFTLKSKIEKELPAQRENSLLLDQMQYAFYKISIEKIDKTLQLYQELFDKEFSAFESALPRVRFKQNRHAKKIIEHTEQKIDTLQKKDLVMTIEKESEVPRTPTEKKKLIQESEKIRLATEAVIKKRLETQIVLALKSIRQNDQKTFFKTMEAIDADIAKLDKAHRKPFVTISKLILDFGEKRFDTTSMAFASTQIGFQNIIDSLRKFTDKTLFVYEEKAFSIRTVFIFAVILFIGFFIAKIYKNFVERFRRTNRIKSLSLARMMANSGYYIIILATFFIALKTIGLDMHTIFLVIGAMLLWLAFGLQSFISNYAIGILLKIDRSIRIGDHIELDPNSVGDVDDMNFRSVTIRASDGVRTTIPNSRFISGTFINHSLEGECRRLEVRFSANKTIPHEILETTILKALEKSDIPYYNDAAHKPQLAIADINRKIVRYALLVWVKKEMTYDMTLARSRFLKLIHKTLYPTSKTSISVV
jgi:hypothetical protein